MEVMTATVPQQLTIYWDGHCPFCSAIKERLTKLDSEHRLHFVDYNDPAVAEAAAERFSPADLDLEMRAQLADGTWRSGYFALAAIMRDLPMLHWLGLLMQAWIFADVGPKLYRWAANHRYGISLVLGLAAPCSQSCRFARS
jgi:predicted DCC family thiol-disulfide oxidoreductase YuxK